MLLHAVPFQKKSPLRVFPRERYVRRETIMVYFIINTEKTHQKQYYGGLRLQSPGFPQPPQVINIITENYLQI